MQTLFQKHARKLSTVIIVLLFSTCLWQLATAGWIQGKAIVAQQLLDYSWEKTLNSSSNDKTPTDHKPWPWADTWPVAKLIVPGHNIEQIILAGDGGNSLAFAPGYSFAGAAPNTSGTTMISAHRDTHFNFLKEVKINELLILQTTKETITYRIVDLQIVDSKSYTLQADTEKQNLVLVTCYPFDSFSSSGSSRYLVFATRTSLTKTL